MPQADRDYLDEKLNTVVPLAPVAGSLNDILSKASGAKTYLPATDSLEALSDKLGGFSGDGGAAQDDSAKAALDLLHTLIDNIEGERLLRAVAKMTSATMTSINDTADLAYVNVVNITDKGILTGISQVLSGAAAGSSIGQNGKLKLIIDGTTVFDGAFNVTTDTTTAQNWGNSLAYNHQFVTSLQIQHCFAAALTAGRTVSTFVSYTTD
jgi:hypothetical protein